jgi:hypothetical protein
MELLKVLPFKEPAKMSFIETQNIIVSVIDDMVNKQGIPEEFILAYMEDQYGKAQTQYFFNIWKSSVTRQKVLDIK